MNLKLFVSPLVLLTLMFDTVHGSDRVSIRGSSDPNRSATDVANRVSSSVTSSIRAAGVSSNRQRNTGLCDVYVGQIQDFYAPNTFEFVASNLPNALDGTNVVVKFAIMADINNDHEYVNIYNELGDLLMVHTGMEMTEHCSDNFYEETVTVTAEAFNVWNEDSGIAFTLVPSAGVGNLCGGQSGKVRVSLNYDPESGICPESVVDDPETVPEEPEGPGDETSGSGTVIGDDTTPTTQDCAETALSCEVDLGTMDHLYFPNELVFSVSSIPDATIGTNVILQVNLKGDLDRDYETVAIKDENGTLIGTHQGSTDGVQCSESYYSHEIKIDSLDFNQWNQDGIVEFALVPGERVSNVCHSTGMEGNIVIKYESACGACPV